GCLSLESDAKKLILKLQTIGRFANMVVNDLGAVAFGIEMDGIVSACNVSDQPELKCPLCKQVMKDDALMSKSTDRLADELFHNKTLRETINQRTETKCNSADSRDQGKEFAPFVSSKNKSSCISQQEPLEIIIAPDVDVTESYIVGILNLIND
ncbi:hypothetical protein Tco_0900026, partial [Tanacetum coccineum]